MRPCAVAALAVCASAVAGCAESTAPSLHPTAVIVRPTATDTIYAGVAISLVGHLDPADSTATLEWSSSLDGDLGIGDSVTAALASPGRHVLSLTARRDGRVLDQRRIALDARRNNAPTLRILATGSRFFADSVRLAVQFRDLEDGAQPHGGFTWESSLDGPLAGSDTLAGTLSVGAHVIRVSARDRGGTEVSDSLRVVALARPSGTAWVSSGFPYYAGEVFISRANDVIGLQSPSSLWGGSTLVATSGTQLAGFPGANLRVLTQDGGALVADTLLRRVSRTGVTAWQARRLTTSGTAGGMEVAEAADGSVVVVQAAAPTSSWLSYQGTNYCTDQLSTSLVAKYSASGTELWAQPLPNACRQSLAAIGPDGTVYAVVWRYDSIVHVAALEGATGSVRWTTTVSAPGAAAPLAAGPDGTVLLRTTSGTLVALSAADGSVRWQLTNVYSGTVADAGGSVYVLGKPSPKVTQIEAHSLASGTLVWSVVVDTSGGYPNTNLAVAADGSVYWAGFYTLYRIAGAGHVIQPVYEDTGRTAWGPFFDDEGNVVQLFESGRLIAWPAGGAARGWPTPHGDHRGTRRVVP